MPTKTAFTATCHRVEVPDHKTYRSPSFDSRYQAQWAEHMTRTRDGVAVGAVVAHNVCDETFTDRDTYTAHMREAHGITLGTAGKPWPKPRRTRAPKTTPWTPAPLGPGAWVEWTDKDGDRRTGQVWALAPSGSATGPIGSPGWGTDNATGAMLPTVWRAGTYLWVIPVNPRAGESCVTVQAARCTAIGDATTDTATLWDDEPVTDTDSGSDPDYGIAVDGVMVATVTKVELVDRGPAEVESAPVDLPAVGEWVELPRLTGRHYVGSGDTTTGTVGTACGMVSRLTHGQGAVTDTTEAACRECSRIMGHTVAVTYTPGRYPHRVECVTCQTTIGTYVAEWAANAMADDHRTRPVEDVPRYCTVPGHLHTGPCPTAPQDAPTAPVAVDAPAGMVEAPTALLEPVAAPVVAPAPTLQSVIVGPVDREATRCDRCGCDHKRGTVPVVTGDGVQRLGLACAARALGVEVGEVRAAARVA